jgi:DNA-directed RNA polymerase alpha subunit
MWAHKAEYKALVVRIAEALKAEGWTQRRIASLVGRSTTAIQKYALEGVRQANREAQEKVLRDLAIGKHTQEELLALKIDTYALLSSRAANGLYYQNVETLGQLCSLTASDLLKLKNFGRGTLKEIRTVLAALGLHLKDDNP